MIMYSSPPEHQCLELLQRYSTHSSSSDKQPQVLAHAHDLLYDNAHAGNGYEWQQSDLTDIMRIRTRD